MWLLGPQPDPKFRSLENCRVTMVCDANSKRLVHMCNLYPEIEGVSDYSAMLGPDGPDAVAVAVPVRFHYPVAKACLEAGKHTLVEKPLASSSAECQELIEIAEQKGLTLMVGHTFLYSAAVRKIAAIIRNGDIGELLCINARRLNSGLFPE